MQLVLWAGILNLLRIDKYPNDTSNSSIKSWLLAKDLARLSYNQPFVSLVVNPFLQPTDGLTSLRIEQQIPAARGGFRRRGC